MRCNEKRMEVIGSARLGNKGLDQMRFNVIDEMKKKEKEKELDERLLKKAIERVNDHYGINIEEIYGDSRKILSLDQIMDISVKILGIPEDVLRSKTKKRAIAEPRFIVMDLMARYCRSTLQDLADLFGKNDHSIIFHARKRVKELREIDPNFNAIYLRIQKEIHITLENV